MLNDSLKVKARKTDKYGMGIFAEEPLATGEHIASFNGEIYDNKPLHWNIDLENHCIQFEEEKWRDSAGIARLINHSCEPNAGIKNLFDVVAMREISPGEEITWDYGMSEDSKWEMECLCNTSSCRKTIGNYQKIPEEIKEKYTGYISEWLIKKYE